MINELKLEFTKKELIDYVMEDIKFNVYDMEDDEFELLQDFSRYLQIIENFKVQFPKTKSVLDNIFNGIRLKANQLFMYLAIPHNNSASVIIREIAENSIILSFLIENSSKFSRNWSLWPFIKIGTESGRYTKDIKTMYNKWLRCFEKDYELLDKKDKPSFDAILKNPYGWVFPKIYKHINLKHIADDQNLDDIYDYFEKLSYGVHSNTIAQCISSRFVNETYDFVAQTILLLDKIITKVKPYIKHQRRQINELNFMYLYIISKLDKYYDNYKKMLKQI